MYISIGTIISVFIGLCLCWLYDARCYYNGKMKEEEKRRKERKLLNAYSASLKKSNKDTKPDDKKCL